MHSMKTSSAQETADTPFTVAIIGAGPAGLMAAEVIAEAGFAVHVYDAKPSAARKFLLAGVGGMNITHAEEWPLFISRYDRHQTHLERILQHFGPNELREWIHKLGINTFVGSSGRVFPEGMKAAPLLRAWLHRLRAQGVEFFMRHRCIGLDAQRQLHFQTPAGDIHRQYSAIVLAMGGGSWPQLGSDGAWQTWLATQNIGINPLLPANCGFNVQWSEFLQQQFAGSPIKNAELAFTDSHNKTWKKRGEFVLSAYGIEGSAVYALSAALRDALLRDALLRDATLANPAPVTLFIDLLPDRDITQLHSLLAQPRKGMSLGNVLRKKLKLTACEVALLHECLPGETLQQPDALAAAIKAVPVTLTSPRPIAEAISSAGGITFDNLTEHLMVQHLPGLFCAGEMLDWEAPTGGYLLTACLATGKTAGEGVLLWLDQQRASQG
jgi:uncharacterized flavoprotein (TIGR03862 family)